MDLLTPFNVLWERVIVVDWDEAMRVFPDQLVKALSPTFGEATITTKRNGDFRIKFQSGLEIETTGVDDCLGFLVTSPMRQKLPGLYGEPENFILDESDPERNAKNLAKAIERVTEVFSEEQIKEIEREWVRYVEGT